MKNLHWVKAHDYSALAVGRHVRRSPGRFQVVQRSIDQQFAQRGQLLNTHNDMATRAFQFTGEIGGHDTERGEGFRGVTEQGFRVDIRNDGEEIVGRFRRCLSAQGHADELFGDFGGAG